MIVSPNRVQDPLKDPGWTPVQAELAGHDGTSPSESGGSGWVSCARRSSWGWQIWRGMWSDGGRRGAMSNRRRGRVSVPDPRVPLSFPAMDVLKQAQTLFLKDRGK